MKKKLMFLILIIVIISVPMTSFGIVDITSKSALLMDYGSGEIIFAVNENDKLPPASVTKVMTLLLTMEAIDNGRISLDDKFVISEYAASMGGTQVYLEQGETQTVEDLIKAVSIRSANDAAVALGEGISGSNEAFIKLMNERAKELGMQNTHFSNASGLPMENHYTTAYDIGLMSRELIKHKNIVKYLTTYMEDIYVGRKKDEIQTLVNTNKLVKDYEGTTGIKTGSIDAAGYCLSASAKRDDLHLIAVILGGKSSALRFEEAKKLLDYGFANYDSIEIGKKGDVVGTFPIEKSDKNYIDLVLNRDVYSLISKENKGKVEKKIVYNEGIKSPLLEGQVIGELIVLIDGNEVDKIDLVAKNDVNNASILLLFKKTIKSFITGK